MTAPILPPAEVEALRAEGARGCVACRSAIHHLAASHEALRALLAEYRDAVREADRLIGNLSITAPDHPSYVAAGMMQARLRALAERDRTPPADAGTKGEP